MVKLLVVGEFMSYKDMENGEPLSDGNGRFLKAMMRQRGIDTREVAYTSVFLRTGSFKTFFGPKNESTPHLRYLTRGKYLKKEYKTDLDHLWARVNEAKPNLVLALGDISLWALTSKRGLEANRGYITEGNSAIPGVKVLSTYSPKQVQQNYSTKPYWVADLSKAAREMQFAEIRYPAHNILIEPTLEDLESFYHDYIKDCEYLSVDIENKPGIITCIGLAPSVEHAIVVPFFDSRKSGNNYWGSKTEEIVAWKWVRRTNSLGKKGAGKN